MPANIHGRNPCIPDQVEDKLHTGKTIVRIAAVEITIDHLFDIGPPESVLPGEILVIDPDKGFKIILYTAVVIRRLRISWMINGGRKGHDLSPWRISCPHNVEHSEDRRLLVWRRIPDRIFLWRDSQLGMLGTSWLCLTGRCLKENASS